MRSCIAPATQLSIDLALGREPIVELVTGCEASSFGPPIRGNRDPPLAFGG
jgi:hypothetical protein